MGEVNPATHARRRIDARLASIDWGQAPLAGRSPASLPARRLRRDARVARLLENHARPSSPDVTSVLADVGSRLTNRGANSAVSSTTQRDVRLPAELRVALLPFT